MIHEREYRRRIVAPRRSTAVAGRQAILLVEFHIAIKDPLAAAVYTSVTGWDLIACYLIVDMAANSLVKEDLE